jgi:beta-lactamase class D
VYPYTFIVILIISGLEAYSQKPGTEIRNDFKNIYDQYQVEGTFVLYDQNSDKYIIYNQKKVEAAFSPASTFKICNSLIGLETGVISDENYVIQWDRIERQIKTWNQDQDMKTAFKNSTVWYYQELARRVGGKQMKYWLDRTGYGNADTSGGIDRFWLEGGLRISPLQQINFLKQLNDNKLAFSQRSMDIVKKMMIAKETNTYILRAKTGWGQTDSMNTGWYVGYFETSNNIYYFANCIQTADFENKNFANARKEIVLKIMETLSIIKN